MCKIKSVKESIIFIDSGKISTKKKIGKRRKRGNADKRKIR